MSDNVQPLRTSPADAVATCPTCGVGRDCHWQGTDERGEKLRCLTCGTLFTVSEKWICDLCGKGVMQQDPKLPSFKCDHCGATVAF
jgi:DNA-directed RNA polymerase subunit RPC12/RpoP